MAAKVHIFCQDRTFLKKIDDSIYELSRSGRLPDKKQLLVKSKLCEFVEENGGVFDYVEMEKISTYFVKTFSNLINHGNKPISATLLSRHVFSRNLNDVLTEMKLELLVQTGKSGNAFKLQYEIPAILDYYAHIVDAIHNGPALKDDAEVSENKPCSKTDNGSSCALKEPYKRDNAEPQLSWHNPSSNGFSLCDSDDSDIYYLDNPVELPAIVEEPKPAKSVRQEPREYVAVELTPVFKHPALAKINYGVSHPYDIPLKPMPSSEFDYEVTYTLKQNRAERERQADEKRRKRENAVFSKWHSSGGGGSKKSRTPKKNPQAKRSVDSSYEQLPQTVATSLESPSAKLFDSGYTSTTSGFVSRCPSVQCDGEPREKVQTPESPILRSAKNAGRMGNPNRKLDDVYLPEALAKLTLSEPATAIMFGHSSTEQVKPKSTKNVWSPPSDLASTVIKADSPRFPATKKGARVDQMYCESFPELGGGIQSKKPQKPTKLTIYDSDKLSDAEFEKKWAVNPNNPANSATLPSGINWG